MAMAKVHPNDLLASSFSTTSPNQESFTLWMKSLIMGTNGCTAFASDGGIVYRVDNYDRRCSRRVYVMDATGNIVYTILRKDHFIMKSWEGYGGDENEEKMGFKVMKSMGVKMFLRLIRGFSSYKAVIKASESQCSQYVMESHGSKLSCKIIDSLGRPVAEVKRKITESGVVLGEDVLAMVVEPHVDHSLVMALVVVFGLLNHKL